MSHRAIQRLRKEREQQQLSTHANIDDDDDDDDDDSEVEISKKPAVGGGFGGLMMMDDDDSDDDDDSSSSSSSKNKNNKNDNDNDSDDDDGNDDSDKEGNDNKKKNNGDPSKTGGASKNADSYARQSNVNTIASEDTENPDKEEEDLDAILNEFKSQDAQIEEPAADSNEKDTTWRFSIILAGIDIKDLDFDYVNRTSLLGRTESTSGPATTTNRRGRQANVFGPPRDGWPRPPRYVGGGIGMCTYENEPNHHHAQQQQQPWPYCDMKEGDDRCPGQGRWFKFTHSDSYERDCEDFERIKASGDPNAMALFVAHHPFVIEPLLQLSNLLYQTNQAQEGFLLLKRVLWVFECACLNSFLRLDGSPVMMDRDLPENKYFFDALFRLVRISYVAGLSRCCLAVSRLILSMDPLRDPMGVLLAMDHFALLENTNMNDLWLVKFAESDTVRVFSKDSASESEYECGLLDLPNWAYSYALALFRIHQNNPSSESEEKANDALTKALTRFPGILEDLLVKNEVDLTGRSFQTDWPSVLGFVRNLSVELRNQIPTVVSRDPVVAACVVQSYETIARIFTQQNHKLWSSDQVLKWCFSNLKKLSESGVDSASITPISPAIIRYVRSDTSDYEDRFQTMPLDAVPLDPGLVAHAQNIDPNRPRLVQRGPRGGVHQDDFGFGVNQQGLAFAGPPTQEIDPDWPLLEIFWRSALPWAHVEGVPPPRR